MWKLGSHEKQARKEIRQFPLPFLPFILKPDLATLRNYVLLIDTLFFFIDTLLSEIKLRGEKKMNFYSWIN